MIELTGDRVRLRAFRPEEHDVFVTSRLAFEEGVSVARIPEDEVRRRAAGSGEMTELGLLLAIDVGGRAVGEIQAYRTGQPGGAFGLGISLFDASDRGRGVGTEAVALLTGYLFQTPRSGGSKGGRTWATPRWSTSSSESGSFARACSGTSSPPERADWTEPCTR